MEIISCQILILILLGFACFCWAETTTEIKIEGAIQTGVDRYAFPVGRTITFSCKTRQFVAARLWILRNDDVLLERTFSGVGVTKVIHEIVGEENTSGVYTCRFYRMVKRRESEAIYFTTENTVELTVLKEDNLPRCSSSLGRSGLPNERTTVFCGAFYPSPPEEEPLWRGLDTNSEAYGSYKFYFADIQLSNQPSDISCGFYELENDGHEWRNICSLPPLTVSQHMELHMEPYEFNSQNETLKFTCSSDPASSQFRWNIFGHSNNIIDDYYTTILKGEIRVKIVQGFGISTLEMPSSAIETDGVHVVTCSTTRENFQIAVSEYTDAPLYERSTLRMITLARGSEVPMHVPSTPYSQFSSNSSSHSVAGFVIVIVLLIVVVFILGIISVWLFRNHRANLKNNNRRPVPEYLQNADGLSVAQRNATYQSLNDPASSSPPAYADLDDVGYATMSTPRLDDHQLYMEPSVTMKLGSHT